jgi:hypothetical protein
VTIRRRNDSTTAKRWGITKGELWRRRRAGLKGCGLCRKWLPVSAFRKSAARTDGLQPNCAPCAAAHKRARR